MIYVHVGRHKTGTTSLQTFLHKCAAGLREIGLLYPTSILHWSQHVPLSNCFSQMYGLPATLETDLSIHMDRLRAEMTAHPACVPLLSSETFFDLVLSGEIDRLESALARVAGSVTFVLCVRDPCYSAASAVKHHLRISSLTDRPERMYLDYQKLHAEGDKLLRGRSSTITIDYDWRDSTSAFLRTMRERSGKKVWSDALVLYEDYARENPIRANVDDRGDAFHCVWVTLYNAVLKAVSDSAPETARRDASSEAIRQQQIADSSALPRAVTAQCKALWQQGDAGFAGEGPVADLAFTDFMDRYLEDPLGARRAVSEQLPPGWLAGAKAQIFRQLGG